MMRGKFWFAGLLVAFSLFLMTGPKLIAAQEATPSPAAGGVTKEQLGSGTSAVAPDRTLILQERTFAPGGDSGAHPAPGPVVLSVESGAVVFSVIEGAATVTRYDATTQESITAGSETTLNVGDSVFYDQGVVHDVRNDGSVQAVTLEARLNPTAAATPTPSS